MTVPTEDGSVVDVFDASGRHRWTRHGLTGVRLWQLDYDGAGTLIGLVDTDGSMTRIERDGEGSPTAIVAPFGQRTELQTDGQGFVDTIADPLGRVVRGQYTEAGLLVGLTDAEGNVSRYDYDEDGRVVREEPALGGPLSLARAHMRAATKVVLLTATNQEFSYEVEHLAEGGQVRRNKCCGTGTTVEHVNTEGLRTITYADGLVVCSQSEPDPRLGSAAQRLKEVVARTPSGHTSTMSATRSVVQRDPNDDASVAVQIDSTVVNGRESSTIYTVTDRGILLSRTSPAGRNTRAVLDERGRLIELQSGTFEPTGYEYDARGRLVGITVGKNTAARSIALGYDAAGHLEEIVDPLGRATRFERDAAGMPLKQILPDGRAIAFAYDANDNLVSLTPPGGHSHRFSYDVKSLRSESTSPLVDGQEIETRYRYDLDRRLTSVEQAGSDLIKLTYDEAGRITEVVTPRDRIEHTYDGNTGLPRMINGPGEIQLTYKYDGPLLTRESWNGAIAGSVVRHYDDDFRVTSLAVASAAPIQFTYDPDGFIVRAGDLAIEHEPHDRILRTRLGSVVRERFYSSFAELTHDRVFHRDHLLYEMEYKHDALGRISQRHEMIQEETHRYDYQYDLAGNLVEVARDGNTVERYAHDTNGNRIRAEINAATFHASYDPHDRLLTYGAASYAYTPSGDLLARTDTTGLTQYNYNSLGNLLGVQLADGTRIHYGVDGRLRRVHKSVDGAIVSGFLYQNALHPIAELNEDSNVVSLFVYAASSGPPSYLVRDDAAYSIVSDRLGSPRLVVDAGTGEIVQRLDYDAYGNVQRDTNPGFQPFGFAGGLYDSDTRLVRFGARDYCAQIGRWTTRDPDGLMGGDTNLFRYVANDPVNRTDPSGRQFFCPPEDKLVFPAMLAGITEWVSSGVTGNATADGLLSAAKALAALPLYAVLGFGSAMEAEYRHLGAWGTIFCRHEHGPRHTACQSPEDLAAGGEREASRVFGSRNW